MTIDFSQLNEEEIQVAGGGNGGFEVSLPDAGPALFRLREVIEFGRFLKDGQGGPKEKMPVRLVFELVGKNHAITKEDGTFIRNHEVVVNLPTKSNSDKSKYMKLHGKLNYDGRVSTPAGMVPSFAPFIGQPFFGQIHHNESADGKKVYVNLDSGGEYTIGAPMVPAMDPETGVPTGEMKTIAVPEMSGAQRCFLWETGVSDDVYQAMWESIAIVGTKNDGTPYKNWIQEEILSTDNLALAGSRAEAMFGCGMTPVENEELDAELAAGLQTVRGDSISDTPATPDVADPLEGLV